MCPTVRSLYWQSISAQSCWICVKAILNDDSSNKVVSDKEGNIIIGSFVCFCEWCVMYYGSERLCRMYCIRCASEMQKDGVKTLAQLLVSFYVLCDISNIIFRNNSLLSTPLSSLSLDPRHVSFSLESECSTKKVYQSSIMTWVEFKMVCWWNVSISKNLRNA